MRAVALALALCATPVGAETALPALYDVAGVAANDVLNIRTAPGSQSPIIGGLGPDATGAEVVALSPDGKWGQVNAGEGTGWVAMAYLAPQPRAPWFTMQGPLSCFGTEPFWSVGIDARMANRMQFTTPDAADLSLDLISVWSGEDWHPVAGMTFAAAEASGMAVIRAEACSDGMSDRAFGLAIDLFMSGKGGADSRALRGCCALAP